MVDSPNACPHCGYCPSCGRSNVPSGQWTIPLPQYPYYPVNPWRNVPYNGTVTITSGTSISSGGIA